MILKWEDVEEGDGPSQSLRSGVHAKANPPNPSLGEACVVEGIGLLNALVILDWAKRPIRAWVAEELFSQYTVAALPKPLPRGGAF